MLVLSRFRSWRQSAEQSSEMPGTWRSSCSVVSSGARPPSVTSEAMVPPVPMRSTRFFSFVWGMGDLLYIIAGAGAFGPVFKGRCADGLFLLIIRLWGFPRQAERAAPAAESKRPVRKETAGYANAQ